MIHLLYAVLSVINSVVIQKTLFSIAFHAYYLALIFRSIFFVDSRFVAYATVVHAVEIAPECNFRLH